MSVEQIKVSRTVKPHVDLSVLSLELFNNGISTKSIPNSKLSKWMQRISNRIRKKTIDDYSNGEFQIGRKYMGAYDVETGHDKNGSYFQRLTVVFEIGIEQYFPYIQPTNERMMSHIVKLSIDEHDGQYRVKRSDYNTSSFSVKGMEPIVPLEWIVADVTPDMLIE